MVKNQSSQNSQGAPKVPKIEIKLRPELKVDSNNNTFNLLVECSVFSDGKAVSGQQVIIKEGVSINKTATTDINGVFVTTLSGSLLKDEQNRTFRFCLAGLMNESEITVTIPVETPKAMIDNDPESLSLYRYHDGQGNFNIFARVLKTKGYGVPLPLVVWYRGQKINYQTDEAGEVAFSLSGTVQPGENEELMAFVDGIEEGAKVKIRRHCHRSSFLNQPNWLFTTNNGRGLIFLGVSLLFWLLVLLKGFSDFPIINSDLFRDKSTGLSSAESLYNEAAKIAGSNVISHPQINSSIPSFIIFVAIMFTFFAVFYATLSWREEIIDGIEEGIEKIIDRDHGRSDDPRLEKWLKYLGMKHVVKNPKIQITTANASEAASVSENTKGHPSLATLFQLDLFSDLLVTIVPKVLKNIFGR